MNKEQLMSAVKDASEPTRRGYETLLANDLVLKAALEAALDRACDQLAEWDMRDTFYTREEVDIDWVLLYQNLTTRGS